MRVEFIGGCQDGLVMEWPEPLLHRLEMLPPRRPLIEICGSFPPAGPVRYEPLNSTTYWLIPGNNQYCTVDTPQWRRYMKECQEKVLEQLEAEWSEDDGNGTV